MTHNGVCVRPLHVDVNIIHNGDDHICNICGNPCEVTVVDMLIVDSDRKPTGDTNRKEVIYCKTCNREPIDYNLAYEFTRGQILPLSAVAA